MPDIRRAHALIALTLVGLSACAVPPKRPPPPEVTVADFDARFDCITKQLGHRVRATDSETQLVSQAQGAVEICSAPLWAKMEAREPLMSPYRQINVEHDRNDVTPWAIARAHEVRDLLRQLQSPSTGEH